MDEKLKQRIIVELHSLTSALLFAQTRRKRDKIYNHFAEKIYKLVTETEKIQKFIRENKEAKHG